MGLDGGLQSPLVQKDLGFASPSAIQDFTRAAESTEKLLELTQGAELGPSVPRSGVSSAPPPRLASRDHLANCGRGLHKSPSRKFNELS